MNSSNGVLSPRVRVHIGVTLGWCSVLFGGADSPSTTVSTSTRRQCDASTSDNHGCVKWSLRALRGSRAPASSSWLPLSDPCNQSLALTHIRLHKARNRATMSGFFRPKAARRQKSKAASARPTSSKVCGNSGLGFVRGGGSPRIRVTAAATCVPGSGIWHMVYCS